jgi:hypothetical protein
VAIKSHTFMTADERLRQEIRRRKKSKLEPLTTEEAVGFLDEMPLAGWCTLTEEEKRYLYLHVEKTWYVDCRVVPKEKVKQQKRKRLSRKREQKTDKETSDASKRTQFAEFEGRPVYTSMDDLTDELQSLFPAGQGEEPKPKYSTALKTAIVRDQLNVRKWVYGRKFKEGFLDSGTNDGNAGKLKKLLDAMKAVFADEAVNPPIKKPPLIRADYELGPNATAYRMTLDAERNQTTRGLEAEFIKNHPGSKFKGYKCLYDYGKGKPDNPDAIVGQKVWKVFEDDVAYKGEVVEYCPKRKWWKILYEDEDTEDLNFRQLCKMEKPPDFSVFRYPQDGMFFPPAC